MSLTNDRGVIPYSEKGNHGNRAKDDLTGYKLAYENDIVLNSMNVVIGSVGLSSYFGCVSPVYYMLYTKKYNIKYYNYIFQTKVFQNELKGLGNGILEIRMRIPMEKLNNVILPIPPIEEQDKIVEFLDNKVSEIDNAVEKTKETIEDYKKYKQAIITKAITKGIDKDIKFKDSGIDWIGYVPETWNIKKIRYLGSLQNGISAGAEKFGFGYPFANYGDIYNNISLPRTLSGLINSTENDRKTYSIKKNDIFFTRTSETIEEVGFSAAALDDINDACFSGFIIRFRPYENNMKAEFYKYYFRSDIHRRYFVKEMNLVTRASLGQDLLKNMPVLIPSEKEQFKIANYLDRKCFEIDKLISTNQKIVEELEQYKKSLIYEYVTGKKKVKSNTIIKTNKKEIKINCKDKIFAQAILLCRVIEKLNQYNLGRVKAEKTLYLIEKDIGFEFDNNYVREAAGPLSESIYKCESVISKKNRWIKVNKVKKHIEYEILSDFSKYSKYYEKYYSNYDDQIEEIIEKVKNYSTDKSEMVATLYASWNDFIIKNEEISDLKIVKDVRENWNDTKKRFNEQKWLDVLAEMKEIELTPKGNGNLTIIKEN